MRRAAAGHHHGAVVARVARFPPSVRLNDGCGQRIGFATGCDEHRAAGAAVGVGGPVPVFDPTIDFEHRLIAPGFVARLGGKVVPVAAMAPCPCHHVDAGPPPSTLPMESEIDLPLR